MKEKHFKVYIVITIIILIIGISIAYATLSQTLKVNSTTTIQSSQTSWNIVIEKKSCNAFYNALAGNVEINGTTITISQITLRGPGDFFRCEFYIENKGEVNAKVQSISGPTTTFSGTGTTATEDANLIKYNFWSVFNWDPANLPVKVGDSLFAKEKKILRIEYGIQKTMTSLPTNPVTFSTTYTINFEQA